MQHHPQNQTPINLNRIEAAARLGIGVRTLDRMVAADEIPSGKFKGRRVFNRDVLDRWAIEQCQGGAGGIDGNEITEQQERLLDDPVLPQRR